jgi:hypothetical protein
MTTLNGHHGQDASEDDDDDDDSTGDDEGDRALLDSGRGSGYSQEKTSSEESTWRFVRGILVEVDLISRCFPRRLNHLLIILERQLRHCY